MKKYITLLIMLVFVVLTASAYNYNGPEAELITLINKERETDGVPPLNLDWELARLARLKTEEMKTHKLFDHESLIYGSPAQLLDLFHIPYTKAGANIAMGQETPMDVLCAWRKSSDHHANIMDPCFTNAGVGLSWDDDGIPYWTLLLITTDQVSQ
ncbi:MAG: CAP domain-containing protein [Defluviitaleaceae bacterium]|nr:CAP domain-containing protein [Defluviitaleaceae bacterium]